MRQSRGGGWRRLDGAPVKRLVDDVEAEGDLAGAHARHDHVRHITAGEERLGPDVIHRGGGRSVDWCGLAVERGPHTGDGWAHDADLGGYAIVDDEGGHAE